MERKVYAVIIGVLAVAGVAIGVAIAGLPIFENTGEKTVTDGLGRTVSVPENPLGVVAINPGSLRLLCYLGLADKVLGVESIENTSAVRPYNFAYPQLGNLPLIGPPFGGDPELIVSVAPDVIFATYMEKGDADSLQSKTGIPVVVVPYGDLGDNIDDFYNSLRIIADVMNVKDRAETLIAYVNSTISDLKNRTAGLTDAERKSVYVGGIGYHGAHGLSSTEPNYPPFIFVNADNVAAELGTDHAFVDDEQVISWNPYFLFIDGGGLDLAIDDIKNGSALWSTLDAVKQNRTYVTLPYNWYTTNMETVLVNAYYVGSVIYPDRFSDLNFTSKAGEIYTEFLGKNVYPQMVNVYGGCYQLDTSSL